MPIPPADSGMSDLFGEPELPAGFRYMPEVLSPAEAWLQTIPFNLSIESEGQEPFHSYFGPISSTTYEDGTVRYAPDPREADARAQALWAHRRDTAKHPVLVARYADSPLIRLLP
jgi:hypothetical protein